MKLFTLFFSIYLLCTFHEIREKKEENLILGKWKVSGMFCSEKEEVPKGFLFTFFKDGKGYLEHEKAIEKEPFIWQINSDTLKLKFERESEIKNVLFKKNEFLFRKLPYNKKHIELRYLDFKECGVELEFIE
ncbi:hypothetical protein [Flavobacterium tyrosinilyticum]|uniref:hypothetical protein n=1 Tax=Flavobacterium tyrosinilyticum TaxID=1658740 RepID=UPI00202F57A8|nr:hypothetical protein [Flavobacterium tyrosinilyticum]MCM0666554.1 hypothetical protein [Flavobacterium tyrosinilyticum]